MPVARGLDRRVLDFVAANPGLRSREIAVGVHARLADVLDVLAGEAFMAVPRDLYASDRAQVYQLAPRGPEQLGRAGRRSQCALIAAVLADGEWHSTSEIHRRCGFSRLNSRIAEMRDPARSWGMNIEHRHAGGHGPDAHEYRFLGYLRGFGPQGRETPAAASLGEAA